MSSIWSPKLNSLSHKVTLQISYNICTLIAQHKTVTSPLLVHRKYCIFVPSNQHGKGIEHRGNPCLFLMPAIVTISINIDQFWPPAFHCREQYTSQIAKFMGPSWGPPGFCRPQMGPMLAPWILQSGIRLMPCGHDMRCWDFTVTSNYARCPTSTGIAT